MANNLTTLAKTLLSSDAIKGISKQTNVSVEDVSSILTNALPELLNGANKQATQKSTAQGFLEALQSHGANDTSNITSFLKNVDMEDGAKIIGHLLGSNESEVTKKVAKTTKASKAGDVAKVLAIAAPLVMSLIGKQTSNNKKDDNPLSAITSLLGKNDIQSLAGSLLGGKDGEIDLGDVLNLAGKFLKK